MKNEKLVKENWSQQGAIPYMCHMKDENKEQIHLQKLFCSNFQVQMM